MRPDISVYPGFLALNYSPYLDGLARMFGARALTFTARGFPSFPQHSFAFIIKKTGVRVFIDGQDWALPSDAGLKWADLYAKINLDPSRIPPAYLSKVVAAGPSFPVRITGQAGALWSAIRNYQAVRRSIKNPRRHFGSWLGINRFALRESSYDLIPSAGNYVFFCGSLWKDESECNENRSRFISACRSLGWLTLEGGFAPRAKGDMPGFEAFTATRRYPHLEWVQKTQQSAVVFNSPAVSGSMSWKLGEFLALGKAIISTPLGRTVAAPLVHGEHMHFVDGSLESIRDAIDSVCRDAPYRARLEQGARDYYLRHLQPARVMGRIVGLAQERAVERRWHGAADTDVVRARFA